MLEDLRGDCKDKSALMVSMLRELNIPAKIALEHASRPMPSPGTPGLFALGDEDRLKNLMSEAGFTDIDTHTMTQPMQQESAAEHLYDFQ